MPIDNNSLGDLKASRAFGPWPSSRCTARAATNLINGNVNEHSPREEVLFRVLASLVERELFDVIDFWGALTFELEAELRIRVMLCAKEYEGHAETNAVPA